VGVSLAGWLGKKVVDHHLDPAFVTVHMFIALGTVCALLYATICASSPDGRPEYEVSDARRRVGMQSLLAAAVLMVQIGLGTRVRAAIEGVAQNEPSLGRGEWLSHIGSADPMHRTMSLLVFGMCVLVATNAYRKLDPNRWVRAAAGTVVALVATQIVVGVGLAYIALPPMLQVLHVTIASLLLGALMVLGLFALRLPLATDTSTAESPTPRASPGGA
jgi:cytochrome c oxidase assembly protein subunit 15